jgi:hypothetical protein
VLADLSREGQQTEMVGLYDSVIVQEPELVRACPVRVLADLAPVQSRCRTGQPFPSAALPG